MLSALFLLLADHACRRPRAADGAGGSAASQSSTDLGNGGHRSTPFITKQQFLVAETRDAKATPWDDGKPKAFLLSTGFDLPAPTVASGHAAHTGLPALHPARGLVRLSMRAHLPSRS